MVQSYSWSLLMDAGVLVHSILAYQLCLSTWSDQVSLKCMSAKYLDEKVHNAVEARGLSKLTVV